MHITIWHLFWNANLCNTYHFSEAAQKADCAHRTLHGTEISFSSIACVILTSNCGMCIPLCDHFGLMEQIGHRWSLFQICGAHPCESL